MSTGEARVHVFQERLFPVLFMMLVTAFFIALVSGIYLATQDQVIRNQNLYLKRAVLFAADIEVPTEAQRIEAVYDRRIRAVAGEGETGEPAGVAYYEVLDSSGNLSGYVIPTTGPGLWGEIEAVVGFDRALSTITGLDFTKQNETPGLGGRITERWFREQFRGKEAPFTMVPEGTEDEAPDEFDAITGATLTSKAVRGILNDLQAEATDVVEGGR